MDISRGRFLEQVEKFISEKESRHLIVTQEQISKEDSISGEVNVFNTKEELDSHLFSNLTRGGIKATISTKGSDERITIVYINSEDKIVRIIDGIYLSPTHAMLQFEMLNGEDYDISYATLDYELGLYRNISYHAICNL